MTLQIVKATIKHFRSIDEMTIEFKDGEPLIICGANNIGKTNFLRALDLFFSMVPEKFSYFDIPYHIAEGSRGHGFKSDITVNFINTANRDTYQIKTTFSTKNNENTLQVTGKKNGKAITPEDARMIVKQSYKFMFIESNNIDLPSIISEIFKEDVLPGLDALRKKQAQPLAILSDFIVKSQEALKTIESNITKHFKKFMTGVEGLNADDWAIKIFFPDYTNLREAISGLVNFTLKDTNNTLLDTKGSGIQRMVLLSLISYISQNFDEKVIWAIDEPEVFLQPNLQKKVYRELKTIAKDVDIIVTTHSPHFIDIANCENTYLFEAEQTPVQYTRRPKEQFIKLSTYVNNKKGTQKIEAIRKHMGLGKNDSWSIVPFNVIVEGEEDKRYLQSLLTAFDMDIPNILVAGGCSKMAGYIEFLKEFAEDLDFIPTVVCLLDHDEEGRSTFKKLESKSKTQKLKIIPKHISRFDGKHNQNWDYEMEDMLYPELIFDAANKFLRKKKYKSLVAKQKAKRAKTSYENIEILRFINETHKDINPDQKPLDFENEGAKKYICNEVCIAIDNDPGKVLALSSSYPEVKNFLVNLLKLGE
ncbi:AAA family ATPase [Cohnella sp. CFH 77786]|uniref:AAA family ATPase n=1 Tax=Cohnella sp. CFH 77786 TaxID=2662265 RepID=UPI001C610453|nr:AAA family ATPase [Cohnella sp. CFH 77786]MBW5448632.1 AAA family ATPase [Cohnella sp. CFH 77786]